MLFICQSTLSPFWKSFIKIGRLCLSDRTTPVQSDFESVSEVIMQSSRSANSHSDSYRGRILITSIDHAHTVLVPFHCLCLCLGSCLPVLIYILNSWIFCPHIQPAWAFESKRHTLDIIKRVLVNSYVGGRLHSPSVKFSIQQQQQQTIIRYKLFAALPKCHLNAKC